MPRRLGLAAVLLASIAAYATACGSDDTTDGDDDVGITGCPGLAATAAYQVSVAVTQAGLSCASDSDCVIVPNSTTCHIGCGALVSEAGAATVAAEVATINASLCTTYSNDNCPAAVAPPCDPIGALACVLGVCRAAADQIAEAGTCDPRTQQAAAIVQAAETSARADAGANLSCAVDSDCVVVTDQTSCSGGCSGVLNTAGAALLTSAVASANAVCADLTTDGCGTAGPCAFVAGAVCTAGVCQSGIAVDAGADADAADDGGSDAADAADAGDASDAADGSDADATSI